MIRVLFFGMLRDIAGTREEACELPATATLAGVFETYATRFPRLRELRRSIVLARNQQFCDPSALVADGNEIAFLPPVSGGSGVFSRELTNRNGNFFALTPDPIETAPLVSRTQQDSDGAVVIFECRVRNQISRITVVHRLGKVPVGEARVVIVVAAAHRKPAFAVAMEAMDRLKSDVAIWKKEYFEDGAVRAEEPSSDTLLASHHA